MNLPQIFPPSQDQSALERLEDQDPFHIDLGEGLALSDCAGDKLSNTTLIVKDQSFAYFSHFQNGRILIVEGDLDSDQVSDSKEASAETFLVWSEEGKTILVGNEYKSKPTLEQAIRFITFLKEENLL